MGKLYLVMENKNPYPWYMWIKTVMGTGQVAKRVPATAGEISEYFIYCKING